MKNISHRKILLMAGCTSVAVLVVGFGSRQFVASAAPTGTKPPNSKPSKPKKTGNKTQSKKEADPWAKMDKEMDESYKKYRQQETQFPNGVPAALVTNQVPTTEKENLVSFRPSLTVTGSLIYSHQSWSTLEALKTKNYFGYSLTTTLVKKDLLSGNVNKFLLKMGDADVVLNPRFSADGRYILFLLGWTLLHE